MVVLFGLPCKTFAQLEGKTLFIYEQGDKLFMRWHCTNTQPHISDIGAALCNAEGMKYVKVSVDRTRGYWGETGYDGVFVLTFITFGEDNPHSIWQSHQKQTWYFYESLNVITKIDPSRINDKRNEIINDPWKYGYKAVYNEILSEEQVKAREAREELKRKNQEEYRLKREEFLQEVEENKYLFTQNELIKIKKAWNIDSYKYSMPKRKKLYNLVIQHPEAFSTDYYYEVVTKYEDLKKAENAVIERIEMAENQLQIEENKRRLIGEWKPEKGRGTVCTITSQNNQLHIMLKYKRRVIYEGDLKDYWFDRNHIPGSITISQLNSSIEADKITINLNVEHEVFDNFSTRSHITKYNFSCQNGFFVLVVTKDGKMVDSVTFRKM